MKKISIFVVVLFMLVLFFPAGQAEAKPLMNSKSIPEQEYAPGTYEVQLNALPGNSEGARLILTRVPTNPDVKLAHIEVEMSRDNGDTWIPVMGADFSGGTMHNPQGDILTVSTMLWTWPGEAGPNGRVMLKGSDVRIIATVYQTFRTAITLESITSTGN